MEPKQPTPSEERAPKPSLSVELPQEVTTEQEGKSTYKILTLENYKKVAEEEQSMMPLQYADDESLRAFYVGRTEELIDKMVGSDADVVVFLDKSARPLAWMVAELWPLFAQGKPMPEFKFVNIDAAQWANLPGDGARPTEEDMASVKVSNEEIVRLREVFTPKVATSHDGEHSELEYGNSTFLDGKKVMIVDEISTTGATLQFANEVMHRAFPEVNEIYPVAWMHATLVNKGQGLYPREIPIWYHHDREEGRGVGDAPDRGWLSRRFDSPDPDSLQLRKEIEQLAQDVRTGDQPIIPLEDPDDPKYAGMTIRRAKEPERRGILD